MDRLVSAKHTLGSQYGYGYDAGDNFTKTTLTTATATVTNTYVNNALNQTASVNGKAYQYDATGNLTDDGARTYAWDAAHRLIRINYQSAPSKATRFQYDGLGRWVAITAVNGSASTEKRYLWCGDELCQSRSSADAVLKRYSLFQRGRSQRRQPATLPAGSPGFGAGCAKPCAGDAYPDRQLRL